MSTTRIGIVICNGPSRSQWQKRTTTEIRIGCNHADTDCELDHCVAIDRMTVASIVDRHVQGVTYWTRTSPLELPRGWHELEAPGIDSGSLAVNLAIQLGLTEIYVVGADGIMGGSNDTAFTYAWHKHPPSPIIHNRHRRAMIELTKQHPNRIKFCYEEEDPDLDTISASALRQRLLDISSQ
jgi:hypothetical protein